MGLYTSSNPKHQPWKRTVLQKLPEILHFSQVCLRPTWVLVRDWKDATDELLGAWAPLGRMGGMGCGWGPCANFNQLR